MLYHRKETKKSKPIVIVIGLCFVLLLIIIQTYERKFFSDDKNESVSNDESVSDGESVVDIFNDMDLSYVTMSVTDYEQVNQTGDYLEWQSRYSIITSTSTLYMNGRVSKESIDVSNVDEIISFHPEYTNENKEVISKMRDNKDGILHRMILEESEQYVGFLLNNGYSLRRKIITPTYAELYLFDEEFKTIRIIVFREYMLAAKITGDELPTIDSYFK